MTESTPAPDFDYDKLTLREAYSSGPLEAIAGAEETMRWLRDREAKVAAWSCWLTDAHQRVKSSLISFSSVGWMVMIFPGLRCLQYTTIFKIYNFIKL